MTILNLGVLAHIDAGKTSLTERLLYQSGAIAAPGNVDDGTTRTDTLDLERLRGITIRAAVTSFAVDGLLVNVVDTPGHPDFIAEVERTLTVLDGAVLVVSAVEGVQAQTVVLWRALRRLKVPTVVFVNKIDRRGADVDRVVAQIRRRLTDELVVLGAPEHEGSRAATVRAHDLLDPAVVNATALADEALFARVTAGPPPPDGVLSPPPSLSPRPLASPCPGRPPRRADRSRPGEGAPSASACTTGDVAAALARGIQAGGVTPVLCGSAITGAGVTELMGVLPVLIPPPIPWGRDEPPAGTVFAIERERGQRRTWIRLWGGTIGIRDHVRIQGRKDAQVTQLAVSRPGGLLRATAAGAGEIVAVGGLQARIGDIIGQPPRRRGHRFAPATLQALVEPAGGGDRNRLWSALAELADEDPLIGLRLDRHAGEARVHLRGEVQREVIEETLRRRFGVEARFRETSVICLERLLGIGSAVEHLGEEGNPYLATIGLRVEPLPAGRGVMFDPGIERGKLPAAFVAATESGVRAALRQGRHGWEVSDIRVTMTASRYAPRQSAMHQRFNKAISSVGADFRNLAPVVVHAALAQARTAVCAPVERFDLDVPEPAFASVAALLGRLGGITTESDASAGYLHLRGTVPTARLRDLATRLPDLTGGEGVLVTSLDHHAPVMTGTPPGRPRSGPDPLDRLAWFREVPR